MALNSFGLGILISAKDEASQVLDHVHGKLTKLDKGSEESANAFAKAAKTVKAGAGIMAAGAASLGAELALAVHGGHFDEALAEAGARMDATQVEMAKLRDAAMATNVTMLGFSAQDAADTLKSMAQEGYNAERSMAALVPTLKLAQLTGQSGAATAGDFTDLLDVFGIKASEAGATVDKMAAAMKEFGIRGTEIQPLLRGVADAAQLAGAKFDDTLITLGLVKSIIPDVGKAAMSTRMAMLQMADEGIQKKLRGIGVVTKDLKTGAMRPLLDVISDVTAKTGKMTEAQQAQTIKTIFGGRAAGGMAAIIGTLSDGIKDNTGHIHKGAQALDLLREKLQETGVADEELNAKLSSLPGQMGVLKAAFSSLSTEIGSSFFVPVFKPIVEGFRNVILKIKETIAGLPAGVKAGIGKAIVIVSALVTAFGAFLAVKGLIVIAVVALKVFAGAIVSAALAFAPMLAAFGALFVMFKAIQISMGESGNGFVKLGQKIKLFVSAISQLFSDGGFSGKVRDELNAAENSGVKSFAIKIFLWVNRIKTFLSNLVDGFTERVKELRPAFEAVQNAFGFLMSAFTGSSASAKENGLAFDSASSAGKSFGQTIATIAGAVANVLTVAMVTGTAVIEVFKAAWASVAPVFTDVGNIIGGVIQFISGLLALDFAMAWQGAARVVGSVVKLILDLVMSIPRALAGVVDKIGKAFGKDFGIADKLNAIVSTGFDMPVKQATVGAAPLFENSPLTAPVAGAGPAASIYPNSPLAAPPIFARASGGSAFSLPPPPSPAGSPGVVAATADNGNGAIASRLADLKKDEGNREIRVQMAPVMLDGEKVGEIMGRAQYGAGRRGYGE